MLKNYLKTAWRNLLKRRFTSFLLLCGLACAFSFSFLISSYIYQEASINQEFPNVENQYLVKSKWAKEGMGVEFCSLAPLAKTLVEEYPHLVKNYYTHEGIGSTVKKGGNVFRESIQPGSAAILSMFDFELLHGDQQTALNEPYTLVLPEELAIKYFGKTDIVGKSLALESFNGEWRDFTIKGILTSTRHNSVLNYLNEDDPILISEESLKFYDRYESFIDWNNAYTVSFLELNEGVTSADLEGPIEQLIKQNTSAQTNENLTVELAGLSTLYLTDNENKVQDYLEILGLVVLFLLLLSVINFINLSLGNASHRLREMGVRKTMGGQKHQAVFQLLFEALILSLSAFFIAGLLYILLYQPAGELLGRELLPLFQLPTYLLVGFLFFSLALGGLSGVFAAFKVASVSPILALKNRLSETRQKSTLKNWLLGAQFTITLLVVGLGIIVTQQLSFILNKDLGFAKDQRIYAATPRNWSPQGVQQMLTYANEFKSLSNIKNASVSYEIPDGKAGLNSGVHLTSQDETKAFFTKLLQVDSQYFDTYAIDFVEGGVFAEQPSSFEVVINEKAAELLGIDPKTEVFPFQLRIQSFNTDADVIGICKDYHFGSLKTAIEPLVFTDIRNTNMFRYLTFELGDGDIQASVSSLQNQWAELMPNAPFDFQFLDDTIQKMYLTEARMAKAASIAQFLVLFIVFLGLIGIINMTLSNRKKELSIRRVLGATSRGIVRLFVKDYILILSIAALIAIPLTYWLGTNWLQSYAFSVLIQPLWFIATLMALVVFVVSIVALQSLRFLRKNPVESFSE